jgi:DNA-binding PadR family transcriptional regulator
MQQASFLILTALAAGSRHGYGIITDVQEISGGLVGMDREEIVDGRLRRYYRLTPKGTDVLANEAGRLQANASIALSRLRVRAVVPPHPGLAGGAA